MVRIIGNMQNQMKVRTPKGNETTAAEKTPKAINPELIPMEKRRSDILLSKNIIMVARIVKSMIP